MQLIDRFFLLSLSRKKQQKQQKAHDDDTIASTTSTAIVTTKKDNSSSKRKKNFLKHFYWNSSKKQHHKQQQEDEAIEIEGRNQELLTQCIEAALLSTSTISFNSISPSVLSTQPKVTISQQQLNNGYRRNKRWSMVDTRSFEKNFQRPQQKQSASGRQRKLSLPPQYSNIGYLASIPEVDSFTSDTMPVMK